MKLEVGQGTMATGRGRGVVLLVSLPMPTEGGEGNMEARCNTRATSRHGKRGGVGETEGLCSPSAKIFGGERGDI